MERGAQEMLAKEELSAAVAEAVPIQRNVAIIL
jgi:hypothetical protein